MREGTLWLVLLFVVCDEADHGARLDIVFEHTPNSLHI